MTENQAYVEAVAAELRAERAAKEMTLDDLAERSGVPKGSLFRYLKGTREVPVGTFVIICAALGVAPGDMIDRASLRVTGSPA